MPARVVVLISFRASVPPADVEPVAEASARASAVTLFFAAILSAPPASTVVSPPMTAEAALVMTLIATPASPGSLIRSGVAATALLFTVELASRTTLPLALNVEAPVTPTKASLLDTMVDNGEIDNDEALTEASAESEIPPLLASSVEASMFTRALAFGAKIGKREADSLLLARIAISPPLRVAWFKATLTVPPVSLSATISIRPSRITTPLPATIPVILTTSEKSGAVPRKEAPL